jgi:Sugar (and other) transporter
VVTAIVTACFATAYPSEDFPLTVGILSSTNNGQWAGNSDENQLWYVNQLKLSNPPENDYVWRVVLYTLHVLKNAAAMTNDMSNMFDGEDEVLERVKDGQTAFPEVINLNLSEFLSKYGVQLAGAALSWFFLDVGFYSQNLFQKDVFLQAGFIPPANRMSALTETMVTAKAQSLIALGSTIPGYWITVFTVDIIGRKVTQIGGFLAMTTFMAAMAGSYDILLNPNSYGGNSLSPDQPGKRNGWITMYAFTFFFANWGPNSTTYIVPAELFPTAWKATGHGFCAAVGKAGAIIGAFGFLFAAQPHKLEATWSFPCSYDTDFYYSTDTPPERLGCKLRTSCPIGLVATGSAVPSPCDYCNPKLSSGCATYAVGIEGALGILVGINILGMFTSFMVPETMGKSLEELNGQNVTG